MPVTAEDAARLAEQVAKDDSDARSRIVARVDLMQEYEFGWMVPMVTEKFLETGNVSDQIPGLCPIVIDRQNGEWKWLGTRRDPETLLQQFLESWRERHQR